MNSNSGSRKLRALGVITALSTLVFSEIAVADNINDTIADNSSGITLVAGEATPTNNSAQVKVVSSQGNDGDDGCNIDPPNESLKITFKLPSGVTASPASLTFTACDTFLTVAFSASAAAVSGTVTADITGNTTGKGTYNNNVKIPITITQPTTGGGGGDTGGGDTGGGDTGGEEPTDTEAPTGASISINGGAAWTNDAEGNVTADLSASDNVGVTSYRLAESSTGLDAASDVTVTPAAASLSLSNVAFTLTGAEAAAKEVWLRVCDAAGKCAEASDTIGWDHTAPTVAYTSASPGANGAGWHNVDVTASFTATDNLSGFTAGGDLQTTGTATTSGEGTAVTVGSPAFTDVAGNTAAAGAKASPAFKIDKTAPTNIAFVDGPAEGQSYYFGFVPAAPTCTAEDALSGMASCLVSGYAATVGSQTLTAKATDVADNFSTAERKYTVLAWTIKGFYAPVDMGGVTNTVKGGSTVPLKFEVFAGDTELTDTSIVKPIVSKVSCTGGATADVEELAPTGGTSLRYDTTGGQFIFNWQTPKQPNTCWSVTVNTADGSSIKPPAIFQLK
ncbi:MAG: PxKF domain-containing protein [Actinomycetota bacterium]|nr:PxKF domain-containing protein [Actinomycetota bacterium]